MSEDDFRESLPEPFAVRFPIDLDEPEPDEERNGLVFTCLDLALVLLALAALFASGGLLIMSIRFLWRQFG